MKLLLCLALFVAAQAEYIPGEYMVYLREGAALQNIKSLIQGADLLSNT